MYDALGINQLGLTTLGYRTDVDEEFPLKKKVGARILVNTYQLGEVPLTATETGGTPFFVKNVTFEEC